MRNRKKKIAALWAAVLMAALLCACGGETASPNAPAGEGTLPQPMPGTAQQAEGSFVSYADGSVLVEEGPYGTESVTLQRPDGSSYRRFLYHYDMDSGRLTELLETDGEGAWLSQTLLQPDGGSQILYFDHQGLCFREEYLDSAGQLTLRRLARTDEAGNVAALTEYDGRGTLQSRVLFNYNEAGMTEWIQSSYYDQGILYRVEEQSYNEDGMPTRTDSYDGDWTPTGYTLYEYDENWLPLRICRYDTEDRLTEVERHFYDGEGLLTKTELRDGEDVLQTYTEYRYGEDGTAEENLRYERSAAGELSLREQWQMDAWGREILHRVLDDTGEELYRIETVYDDWGSVISVKQYNADGTVDLLQDGPNPQAVG